MTSLSPPPVPVVNRYVREETVPMKKTDKGAESGYVGRLPEVDRSGGGHGGYVGGGGYGGGGQE